MKISAVILAKHPELNPLLLESLTFADEIIVIADSSVRHRERSVAIQKGDGLLRLDYETRNDVTQKVKIFNHPLNNDFSSQRNFGIEKASSDWVLFVDDDEYVGSELAREIKTTVSSNLFSGCLVRRLDVVFHQPLRHGETGNIKILRLAKRNSGKFLRPVHEVWKISGRVGELSSPLYHIKDRFVSEFIGRMSHYGPIDAKILSEEDKPFSWFRLLFNPPAKFKLNYVFKRGFLDGTAGLFSSYLMAVQSLTVRVFQWQNQN